MAPEIHVTAMVKNWRRSF